MRKHEIEAKICGALPGARVELRDLTGTADHWEAVVVSESFAGRSLIERHRMVFASHMTPRDRPIGPDVVRKTIRQAYARAGLPYTRAHLLRHTMASRLLLGGSSLKEVADVLRHRSLNTTLVYAKLDSRRLVEVALPWPGTSTSAVGRQS